jgi:hypothetical protein
VPENKKPALSMRTGDPWYHLGWRSAPTYRNAPARVCQRLVTFMSAISGGPGCAYLATESRFGQQLRKDHSWGGNDPARNIPELLDDAWHERCFRQRHREEYLEHEDGSISLCNQIWTEQILHEIGSI